MFMNKSFLHEPLKRQLSSGLDMFSGNRTSTLVASDTCLITFSASLKSSAQLHLFILKMSLNTLHCLTVPFCDSVCCAFILFYINLFT